MTNLTLRLLRLPQVLERRARTRSAHYNDITNRIFPPPIHLGERCSAWPEHEVDAVIRAQISGATRDELRTLVAQLVADRKSVAQAAA